MIAEFILFLFVAGPVWCSNAYYVTPNHDTLCLGQPCLTLSQYVQQSVRYFTSDTTFMFLAGDHSLHNDLALEGVTNVTLIGDSSQLPTITSKIKCTRFVYIEFDTVSKINITALAFASCGKETSNDGAIHLTDARDFSLSDCIFHDNAFTALSAIYSSLALNKVVFTNNSESALRIRSSTVTSIHNCTFSNNSGDQGGAAAIISSFVNFTGTTVFENNSGNYGGSLYIEHTTARFTGISLFRNGYASESGGVLYATSASIVSFHGKSSFINNSADYVGGGIWAFSSKMNFEGDSSFIKNSAAGGGGITADNSAINFKGGSSFINNSADYSGGGVHTYNSTMNFDGNSSFISNSADYQGGGIWASSSNMNFEEYSNFINNSADSGGGIIAGNSTITFKGDSSFINNSGGGIHAQSSSNMNFEGDSSFINNSAEDQGGGIWVFSSNMKFDGDSNFINNSADYEGGGILVGNSTINFKGDSSFINNSVDYSGGVIAAINSTINFKGDSRFISNSGGGIHTQRSTTNFEGHSSFINNSADNEGGGIFAGNSTINFKGDSSFINNTAGLGGGVHAYYSTMNFEGDSSFINNSAVSEDEGGGIIAYIKSIMYFEGDSSFSNNGGGIFAENSTMNFEGNSSFINNSADLGGGIFVNSSTINFEGDSSFINSLADLGGGIFAYNSTINFKGDSSFINSSADLGGGNVAFYSTMNFEGDSSFMNNSAEDEGGGMYVDHSTMSFEGDNSFMNNSADSGGGMFIDNSTVNFEGDSSFINNLADSGGGIFAGNSTISFKGDSSFMNNSARYIGGGIYAYTVTMNFDDGNSSFTYNSAVSGGGISTFSSTVNFDEKCTCNFNNNLASIDGGGIIAVTNTAINFDGNCQFDNNSANYGGGIMAITSTMNFYESCHFTNNSAIHGGGIVLDASKFYLFQQKSATVYFTGNHARRGGAITVADSLHDLSQYCRKPDIVRIRTKCFLQINPYEPDGNIDVSLFFENNSASEGGDHWYGGAIDYCTNVLRFNQYHSRDLIETLASGLSEDKLSDISSDPIKVCICDITDHPDCSRNINVTTYPGESFHITIVAVGQRAGTVAAVVQSIFDKEGTANLKAEENFQSSNKTCTTLTYTVFSNTSSERIDLYAEGPCGPGLGQPLSLIVKLQLCPPGFELSPTIKSCICEKRLQTHTNSCDINSQTIFRADHSDFWVGYDNETGGLILHPHCPFDYCTSVHVSLTLNDSDLQCNYNRSGLLCGKCLSYFSLVLGTSRCLECSNNFLALITAFALAGLLLVFFLLICRLTVTVGTISGLIFYANIVSVNQTIFFPQDPNFSIRILKVFIAWLNLDLGIETCFYNGMDAYAKTWLQFVFPIYIWVLVGIVIVSSRYLPIVARTLGTNPVAVLATLFLLSYTKLLRTILAILSFTNLQYPNDITRTVWLNDGNITYFGGRHIPLFIIAITVFFALFLPYTLLLLLGQCLQARSNWRILAWVNSPRLKTIMDAYHGPYKVQRRYWPGLLLVIRIILLLVFSSNALHDPSVNLLAINTCTIALLALIWLVPGVHRKWYLEAIEAFFILNLSILAAATLYIRATGGNQAAVAYILVGSAFLVFIGIIVYHVYLQISDIRKERKIRNYRRLRALQADEEIERARAAAENQVPSQLDLERVITDETRALVPTTEVVVCKRETLLAMEADQTDTI